MNALNTASLINLLGFTVGVALYALLLVMVVRHRKNKTSFSLDFLLLATAILGLLWNLGELSVLIWKDFGAGVAEPVLLMISYSALGFLPSVVVHSALKNAKRFGANARFLIFAAYGLSFLAMALHFYSTIFFSAAPSNLALQILTFASLALVAGLLIFNFRRRLENKTILIAALLIFAVSGLHLSLQTEENSWVVELVAHQSSLPLVLAILVQDYRFAFADLFLKRALSLLLLAALAFGLYVAVAVPLLAWHETHDRNDVQAAVIVLTLWMTTALIYPSLHRAAVWFVDKIVLRRVDYEILRAEISGVIEKQETIENVLNEICEKIAVSFAARQIEWKEIFRKETEANLPVVNYDAQSAKIFVPTVEAPFYEIAVGDFSGGRRLLSDDVDALRAVALLAARRIDALRVADERYNQKMREQEFSRLATEAQLSALRAQINPHFLFNALTTIGYLIQTAPEKAFSTLMKLTRLLRRVLKSSGEFSTLGEELELVESYLEIERARFEERLEIEIEVAEELEKIQIPALVLQPLVENAVKHGVSKSKNGGKIFIRARLETDEEKVFLNLSVVDSGAGVPAQIEKKGVGLANVEQRLRSYYGENAALEIESRAGNETRAEIKIQISDSKFYKK